MLKYQNVSLVVSSCDKYKELIEPFFEVFFNHFKTFDGKCFTTASGDFYYKDKIIKGINQRYSNMSFSSRLKILLRSIDDEFVLFFLDDFFLLSDVNEDFVADAIKLLNEDKKIAVVQLFDVLPSKKICVKIIDTYFSLRDNKTPYVCTTQASIWRKKELLNCLREGESPWDFEIIGSYRLRTSKKKILYRNDESSLFLTYNVGGVLHRGKFQEFFNDFRNYPFYTELKGKEFTIKEQPTTRTRRNAPVLFGHHISVKSFLNFIYPFISKIFPFVHRFGVGYPKYVTKHLSFKK